MDKYDWKYFILMFLAAFNGSALGVLLGLVVKHSLKGG